MRPVLAPALAAIAVLALGACDADDFSQNDDVDPTADSVRSGLAVLYAGLDAPPDVTAEGACFATALMSRLSLDDLVDSGIVGDDGLVAEVTPMLDVDVAGAWVDALESCTSYAEVAARADAPADQPAYVACLSDAIEPDRVRDALVATLSGGFSTDPDAIDLAAAQASCAPTRDTP